MINFELQPFVQELTRHSDSLRGSFRVGSNRMTHFFKIDSRVLELNGA